MAPNAETDSQQYVFTPENVKKFKPLDDFRWSQEDHFHYTRKKEMLKKYPQIEKLYGPEPITGPLSIALTIFQLSCAIYLRDSYDKWWYWVILYVVGATCSHAIFLAIHEITHFLAYKSAKVNFFVAMIVNFPIVFPYCVSFREFHYEHHIHLGVEGTDADLPTKAEALLFHNVLGKAAFCFFQIFFYALRPVIVHTKSMGYWHFVNIAVQLSFDAALYYFYGPTPFLYLFLSAFLAGSFHPCAGHFLSEHLSFVPGYETFSYYGILNWVSFNVGYHNEHHDFPNIPWTRLPKLKAIAPEFYDQLPCHTSWTQVLWVFMTNPNISLFNRVKRHTRKTK